MSRAVPSKRPYDARRRRERADEERKSTRTRVIDAATRLFIARGYKATTMADIAREAGVAMQSVYSAGRSKADLMQVAVDRAVAGDDQEVLVHARPAYAALAEEPDAVRQVELIAQLICDIQERSAPIQAAYLEAAAVEVAIAKRVQEAHVRRLETFGVVLGMIDPERLRYPVQECVDTTWAVASAEVFLLLRDVRGWDWGQIRIWLTRTLVGLLLVEEPGLPA